MTVDEEFEVVIDAGCPIYSDDGWPEFDCRFVRPVASYRLGTPESRSVLVVVEFRCDSQLVQRVRVLVSSTLREFLAVTGGGDRRLGISRRSV